MGCSTTFTVSNMTVFVEKDEASMGIRAAELFSKIANEKPAGNYGFATGSTPLPMYRELIRLYQEGKLDFSQMTTFNLDEYAPIRKNNPQSYDFFMRENLFDHVNLDYARFNIPNGEADDFHRECERYEAAVRQSGGIDLQILGVGTNGHIGFNEPNNHFTEKTNYVDLTASTIESNRIFFTNEDEMPKHAVSMGIGTILSAERILLLATGPKKAEVIAKMLVGPIHPEVPVSVLRLHRNVTVVLDQAAAELLILNDENIMHSAS